MAMFERLTYYILRYELDCYDYRVASPNQLVFLHCISLEGYTSLL